jgi:hypothetical protein
MIKITTYIDAIVILIDIEVAYKTTVGISKFNQARLRLNEKHYSQ